MDFIAIHAASKPDTVCLIEGERAWTWAEFLERRNRLAHSLAGLGLSAGEKVVVYAHNSLEALLAPAGARALGAVPVPMNHRLVAEEVAYILDHSDGVIAFADDSFIPVVEQVRPGALKVRHWILMGAARRPWALHLDDLMERGSPDTPAAAASAAFGGSMIYTGGTTGKPKGALRGAVNPTVLLGSCRLSILRIRATSTSSPAPCTTRRPEASPSSPTCWVAPSSSCRDSTPSRRSGPSSVTAAPAPSWPRR